MASPFEREDGQASVELVAILPALIVCVLIAGHAVAAGWALWSAAGAARAGARAEHVGGDGEAVARRALPWALRGGAEVEGGDVIRVEVRAPVLLPGGRGPALSASATLDPADG
jgi:pilus assembly protein CpaE